MSWPSEKAYPVTSPYDKILIEIKLFKCVDYIVTLCKWVYSTATCVFCIAKLFKCVNFIANPVKRIDFKDNSLSY